MRCLLVAVGGREMFVGIMDEAVTSNGDSK
jgi:hypothetical protein